MQIKAHFCSDDRKNLSPHIVSQLIMIMRKRKEEIEEKRMYATSINKNNKGKLKFSVSSKGRSSRIFKRYRHSKMKNLKNNEVSNTKTQHSKENFSVSYANRRQRPSIFNSTNSSAIKSW